MNSQALSLHTQVAVLQEKLNTALREKVLLEQALLQVSKLLSSHSTADTGTLAGRPASQHHAEEKNVQNPPKHSNQGATRVNEDLLDSPPELDLPMVGVKTTHDGHGGDFEPLTSSWGTTSSKSSRLPSTATVSFNSTLQLEGHSSFGNKTVSPLLDQRPRKYVTPTGAHWEAPNISRPFDPSSLSQIMRHADSTIQQSQRALGWHERSSRPSFYAHGIRYCPPGALERTFHRVLIEGVRAETSPASLLSKVYGGTIVSCELMDTVKLMGSMTAFVRFKDESEALGFVKRTVSDPLTIQDHKAIVTLIKTPTYPLPDKLYYNIHFGGYTRCLKIQKFSRLHGLRGISWNNWAKYSIEFMRIAPDGVLFMRFTSIEVASKAHDFFLSSPGITSHDITFLPDPCAQADNSNESTDQKSQESSEEGSSESGDHTPSTSTTIVAQGELKGDE